MKIVWGICPFTKEVRVKNITFAVFFFFLTAFGQEVRLDGLMKPSAETAAQFWAGMPAKSAISTAAKLGVESRAAASLISAPGVVEIRRLENQTVVSFSLHLAAVAGAEFCLATEYDFMGQILRGQPGCYMFPGGPGPISASWEVYRGNLLVLGDGPVTFRVCAKWDGKAGCVSADTYPDENIVAGYGFYPTIFVGDEGSRIVVSGLQWADPKTVTVAVDGVVITPLDADFVGNLTGRLQQARPASRVTVCVGGACSTRTAYAQYPQGGKG